MPKYRNVKTEYQGLKFDSKLEAKRYGELKLLERAGHIKDLRLQVKYELLPKKVNKNGKLEKTVCYYADFVYQDGNNTELTVEDVKGIATREYIIKRKLMLHVHGITINEIKK